MMRKTYLKEHRPAIYSRYMLEDRLIEHRNVLDEEVQEYIQKCYFSLKFSPVVETVVKDIKRNPKRMQREAKKQMLEIGIGTKSQQALKLQQEQNKQERKEKSRKNSECLN